MKKPDSCKGCPFYDKSKYFTPDDMIPGSEVLILAQNPGAHEEQGRYLMRTEWHSGTKYDVEVHMQPQPLIGPSGKWLREEFWPLTKLDYTKVSRANMIKCRPNNINDLPQIGSNKGVNGITVKMLKAAITHCTQAHLKIQSNIRYIMAMGGISLYALTGEESITNWRGWCIGRTRRSIHSTNYQLEGDCLGLTEYYTPSESFVNIFPVIHIASLFKNPQLYHATLSDFIRFGKLVRGEWPIALPEIIINNPPVIVPKIIGFDTEYDYENTLEMWSLADAESNVYVTDGFHARTNSRLHIYPNTRVVTQNGLVDLPHFKKLFDVADIRLEDCMLAWSVLWPGELANLDYMTSILGGYNRHKHLRTSNDTNTKYLYAGLDADTTLNHVWKGIIQDFKRDRLCYDEYVLRRQPLLYPIDRFQQRGARVYTERVNVIANILDTKMESIAKRVKILTNVEDFNIGSNLQVSEVLHGANRDRAVTESNRKVRKSNSRTKSVSTLTKTDRIIEQLKLELGI